MKLADTLTQLGIVDQDSRERILCAAEAERLAAMQPYRTTIIDLADGFIGLAASASSLATRAVSTAKEL